MYLLKCGYMNIGKLVDIGKIEYINIGEYVKIWIFYICKHVDIDEWENMWKSI